MSKQERVTKKNNLRGEYAKRGLSQIPRLLSLENRNEFSKTYGCFNRLYWLDKAIDFPTALAQFGVHSLALAYTYKMPGNIYHQQPKIKEWIIAGMKYWSKVQHGDGSFDEFYPNERGWAGPTGFLLYGMLDSYRLIKNEFPKDFEKKFLETCHKAGLYLAKYDEIGILANHHAMALLPIYESYLITKDKFLLKKYQEKFRYFKTLFSEEGWGLEYDGPDLGYLSATVSFLTKLYKINPDPEILKIIKKAVKFTSYFVYPNGFYAGTIGSRNTLHFYPHGYEYFAQKIPLAGTIAEKLLVSLSEGKLVPPEIQADRYFLYRIPELLQSYLDYHTRPKQLPKLPYQGKCFFKYFKDAQIFIKKQGKLYLIQNLRKGGVIKAFNTKKKNIVLNDCGITLRLDNGRVVTSQWNDKNYQINIKKDKTIVMGKMSFSKQKIFNPLKFIIFRLGLILTGWNTRLSYWLKGLIRLLLMTGNKNSPVGFNRVLKIKGDKIKLVDEIKLINPTIKVEKGKIGDELPIRYVPQSRYFQSQELEIDGHDLSKKEIRKLNKNKKIEIIRNFQVN